MQVVGQTSSGVVDEAVLADLEGEVHVRQCGLCTSEADLAQQPNHDWEATACSRTCLAHVWAEVLGAGVTSKNADEDFLSRNAHHQRAEPLDKSSNALLPQTLAESTDCTVNLDVGVRWLSSHRCPPCCVRTTSYF